MPHQCTECGREFPDGSKEMLSGCPDCGGNTFQFKPPGGDDGKSSEAPTADSSVSETVSRATRTVRNWVTDRTDGPNDGTAEPADRTATSGEPAGGDSDGRRSRNDQRSDRPDLGSSGDYPEWPNPDGADTSGVGKGPSARRNRESSRSEPEPFPESEEDDREDAESSGRDDRSSDPRGRPDASRDRSDADEFEWTEEPASHESSSESGSESPAEPEWGTDRIHARAEDTEDDAQASARSDVVTPDELPGPTAAGGAGPAEPADESSPEGPRTPSKSDDSDETPPIGPVENQNGPGDVTSEESTDGRVVDTPSEEERPDLDDLREELNEQFESIKIVSPGQYELNLMELYDRDEYIISLREDGRYVIEVAESWRENE